MAAYSTLNFAVLAEQKCCDVIHPFTDSCFRWFLHVFGRTCTGSVKIFTVLYSLSLLLKIHRKGLNSEDVIKTLKNIFWSTSYATMTISTTLYTACIFRKLLGRFTSYFTCLIPSVMGSVFFMLEMPERWKLREFVYGNLFLEHLFLLVERRAGRPISPNALTVFFMVCSAALLFLLRRPDFRRLTAPGEALWFFYPPMEGEKQAEGTIYQEVMETVRPLLAGVGLQAARVALRNLHRPAVVAEKLMSFDTYRLGLFLGGYPALYKVGDCLLRLLRGKDDARNAIPAGLLAGAALRLCPQPMIALTAFTFLVQILLKLLSRNIDENTARCLEVTYTCLVTGYLVHLMFVDPDGTPKGFSTFIHTISSETTAILCKDFLKFWHVYRLSAILGGI